MTKGVSRFGSDEDIAMCIYTITNLLNGKIYVGKTVNKAKSRWISHLSASRRPKSYVGQTLVARALAKYGEKSFRFDVIDIAENEKSLNLKEAFWIKELKSISPQGYNLTTGGEGHRLSECTRKKLRASSRRLPSVTRVKVTRSDGKVFDSITEAAKITGCTTKAIDVCFKENWRTVKGFQFKRGIHKDWELQRHVKSNGRIKFSYILRSDGVKYSQVKEAAKDLGVHRNSILLVMSGAIKMCKGYSFERVL